MLLLPGRDADRVLPEGALQIPAGRLPVRAAPGREPRPLEAGAGAGPARHRRLRREPLLRRVRRICQGGARRHPRAHHGAQSRPRGRAAAPPPDAVVPQHLVVEGRLRGADPAAVDPAHGQGRRRGRARAAGEAALRRRSRLRQRGGPALALHRERGEQRTPFRRAERAPAREGRLPCRAGGATRRQRPSRGWHEVRGAIPRDGSCGWGRRAPPAPRASRVLARLGARGGLRRGLRRAQEGNGRLLRRDGAPGRRSHLSSGMRQPHLVETVLLLWSARLAPGRSPLSAASRALPGAERALGPRPGARRDLHARQVGVPLVRGLGPGIPHGSRSRSSIPTSRASSSASCCASGTWRRRASSRPTSTISAT